MPRPPALTPANQFPAEALRESVVESPKGLTAPASHVYTWMIATAADAITPWGRDVYFRDRQLRDFWPTESYLAGALVNVSFRNAAFEWEIRGTASPVETAITDVINSAIAGDSFGWTNFILKFSQDLYAQDNGAFIELIRDPGQDANSKFKDEKAPVIGIAHLDSNQCTRTGDPKAPVIYTDVNGKNHKMKWYEVIPFSDYPSAIENMHGVGVCAVSRSLRLAQIMRSIMIYKDEKISGRHFKSLHIVSGVSRQDISDILTRGKEDADNEGLIRYMDPAILASLDPEKPVSTATIDIANLPDNFDFDGEMKWYISGLALCFGVDYQEFAPLPGGGLGSAAQSQTLIVKTSGKGPAMFMKIAEAFSNYGVLPRGYKMIFEDLDQQRAIDKQTVQKLFQEEMALAVRNGVLTASSARKIGLLRGIYTEQEMAEVPEGFGDDFFTPLQPYGGTGGNTIVEDSERTRVGTPEQNSGAGLRKETPIEITNIVPPSEKMVKALQHLIKEPVINVNVEPTPVTVNVDVPPANINVNPTPVEVNVPPAQVKVEPAEVTVNVPKQKVVKKQKQKVNRDMQGNIESTETTLIYED